MLRQVSEKGLRLTASSGTGGGAAGMAASLFAARSGASVTLLEMKGYVKRLPGKRFSLAEKEG